MSRNTSANHSYRSNPTSPIQMLLVVLTASGIVAGSTAVKAEQAQPGTTATASATSSATSASKSTKSKKTGYRHPSGAMPDSARQYYAMTWGVDQLSARLVESGQLVRFDYRIVDPAKAAPLHDRASSPQMLDAKAQAVLSIPTMEKVGPLRQSTEPQYGKSYWMTFSNKGNLVKSGHRVSVVIGPFRVDGLLVQ